jgi:hypothetical protein
LNPAGLSVFGNLIVAGDFTGVGQAFEPFAFERAVDFAANSRIKSGHFTSSRQRKERSQYGAVTAFFVLH